ncbi:MAG: hypothetical protein KDB87_02020, partial [Flavobacteriales bacterium]|nr:hypothetical protein [Flavobacteriales bacterium]
MEGLEPPFIRPGEGWTDGAPPRREGLVEGMDRDPEFRSIEGREEFVGTDRPTPQRGSEALCLGGAISPAGSR